MDMPLKIHSESISQYQRDTQSTLHSESIPYDQHCTVSVPPRDYCKVSALHSESFPHYYTVRVVPHIQSVGQSSLDGSTSYRNVRKLIKPGRISVQRSVCEDRV
jgi:hypothetical protein